MRWQLPEGTYEHPINKNRAEKLLVSVWDFGPSKLAGFQIFDIMINKTYFTSFCALDRAKKDQARGIMHPLRNHEYVLVFKKTSM